MNLGEVRATVSSDQRLILDQIWEYYLSKGLWIPSGTLYRRFGKDKTLSSLKTLGGSIVFTSVNMAERERFVLTFLGALLTSKGPRLEITFLQYLDYIKRRLEEDDELKRVDGADAQSQLQLDDEEAKSFVEALRLSPFINGGGFGGSGWSAGLPSDIDDLLSEMSIRDYFEPKALNNYDPKVPLKGRERVLYLDQRSRQIFPEPDLSLADIDPPTRPSTITYDVFLSYASDDSEEAQQIFESIISAGGNAFLSMKSLKAGDDFAEEIRKALHDSGELWLLLTRASLKSEWVISEWGAAWALKKRIVPILLHCDPEDAPERIRKLHCIDFDRYPEVIQERFPEKTSDLSNVK
jgi:TIR domain